MPTAAKRPCLEVGCPELVEKGRCSRHTKSRELKPARGSSAAKGYGYRWQRLRIRILDRDYWQCRSCGNKATDVDHIIAKNKGGTDDPENLQALCHKCHSRKTAEEDGRFGNRNDHRTAAV